MNSSTSARLVVTILGWALLMAAMVILARLLSPTFGSLMTVALIFLTLIGTMVFGFMWMWGRLSSTHPREDSSEALIRQRLSTALRDLSDSELIRLRQRLASGELDDEQLLRLMDESDISKVKRS